MEDITITQDQLFDVIKRTMSLNKEYVIKKLDNDGNFIVSLTKTLLTFLFYVNL